MEYNHQILIECIAFKPSAYSICIDKIELDEPRIRTAERSTRNGLTYLKITYTAYSSLYYCESYMTFVPLRTYREKLRKKREYSIDSICELNSTI